MKSYLEAQVAKIMRFYIFWINYYLYHQPCNNGILTSKKFQKNQEVDNDGDDDDGVNG